MLRVVLHPVHIGGSVGGEGAGLQLNVVRGNFQPGGVAGDDILPVVGRFQVDVHRQHLQNLDEAVVPGDHHPAHDVLDGQPGLDAVSPGPAPGGLDRAAENQLFYIHFLASPR